jgi:N-acetylmuramoyl-L-alanine amidase
MFALGLVILAKSQIICIDPGHPSEVGRGASGRHTTEIAVAWQVAKLVKARLEHDGYQVVLTKHREGEFVTNRKRAEIANEAHAALLLRLHCDAGSGSGFAVYYPDRVGTAPNGDRGPDRKVLAGSLGAARTLHSRMHDDLAGILNDRGLHTDRSTAVGAKLGALNGSIYSKVPTVLIEMVVLTNRKDEGFVNSASGKSQLASAIADAAEQAVR